MSFASVLIWTLVRATAVATVAVMLGVCVRESLDERRRVFVRWLIGAALAAVWLTPQLLTAYGWADFSLSLVRRPIGKELFYAVVLCLRLLPVAVLVLWVAPQAVLTAPGRFCAALAPQSSGLRARRWAWWWARVRYGPIRFQLLAGMVCWLMAFEEFEMAARFGVRSWTVWLFDAQAGGLAIGESLRWAAWPAGVQGVVVVVGVWLLRGAGTWAGNDRGVKPRSVWGGRFVGGMAVVSTVAAVVVIGVVPAAVALRGAVQGAAALAHRFALWDELGNSVMFAGAGSLAAMVVSAWLLRGGRCRRATALVMCLPGLLGALVLGLVMLWLVQPGRLAFAYDSPVLLMIALMLLLLPLALVLRLAVDRLGLDESYHAAVLLRRSRDGGVRRVAADLWWRLRGRARCFLLMLLFYVGYFELVASALLAPVARPVASVRLNNLMHYGHSPVLSAMLVVMVLIPVVSAGVVLIAMRWRVLVGLGSVVRLSH